MRPWLGVTGGRGDKGDGQMRPARDGHPKTGRVERAGQFKLHHVRVRSSGCIFLGTVDSGGRVQLHWFLIPATFLEFQPQSRYGSFGMVRNRCQEDFRADNWPQNSSCCSMALGFLWPRDAHFWAFVFQRSAYLSGLPSLETHAQHHDFALETSLLLSSSPEGWLVGCTFVQRIAGVFFVGQSEQAFKACRNPTWLQLLPTLRKYLPCEHWCRIAGQPRHHLYSVYLPGAQQGMRNGMTLIHHPTGGSSGTRAWVHSDSHFLPMAAVSLGGADQRRSLLASGHSKSWFIPTFPHSLSHQRSSSGCQERFRRHVLRI